MSEILTQPFVSSMPALDATADSIFTVNVLGGATTSQIAYQLISAETGEQIVGGAVNVADSNTADEVRTFEVPIAAGTMQNNKSYRFRVFSVPQDSTLSNSPWSQYVFVKCYAQPTLSIKTVNGGTVSDLADNTQINTDQLAVSLAVDTSNSGDDVYFSYGRIRLRGVKGATSTVVWESERLYALQSLETIVEGFERTDTAIAPYDSYTIEAVGYTADDMKIMHTVKGVTCVFEQTYSSDVLELTDNCTEGLIHIRCVIPSTAEAVSMAIQRRAKGDTLWITLQSLQTVPSGVEMDDRYATAGVVYEYRIVLYNAVSAPIAIYAGEILSTFYDAYICDSTNAFKLTNAWTVASAKANKPSAVYEPYGAKYPTVAYNATTNYDSATTSAILLAPSSTISAKLDVFAQTKLIQAFRQWLTNGQAKILKDFNGGCKIIAVTGVQISYNAEMYNALATVSFDWVEVGEFAQKSMESLGLVNRFVLATNQLATPQNVAVVDSVASWDAVQGATQYGVVINNDDWGDYTP